VETVGVGQDEVDIVKLADVTVVVLVPGLGDEVQALKAGIMEIADVFVLNKADSGVDRLEQEVRGMLSLAPRAAETWRPPLVRTVATSGEGIAEVQKAIAARLEWIGRHGGLADRRRRQWREPLQQMLRDALYERLLAPKLSPAELDRLAARIAGREQDPYSAVAEVLGRALDRMVP
jgi:LAO/AO transport system kinase